MSLKECSIVRREDICEPLSEECILRSISCSSKVSRLGEEYLRKLFECISIMRVERGYIRPNECNILSVDFLKCISMRSENVLLFLFELLLRILE